MGSKKFMCCSMDLLPDGVLVDIGVSVAKVCGLRDFVSLGMTSKRLRAILLQSEATIADVIRCRTRPFLKSKQDERRREPSSTIPYVSPPPPTPSAIESLQLRTLEDLWFFECVYGSSCRLAQHDIRYFGTAARRFPSRRVQKKFVSKILRSVLRTFPSAIVVVEYHESSSTSTAAAPGAIDLSFVDGIFFCDELNINWKYHDRVLLRRWDKTLGRESPDPDHYLVIERRSCWWMEVYIRLTRTSGLTENPLDLPPRPNYYQGDFPPSRRETEQAIRERSFVSRAGEPSA